jgi:hypothetical protein
MCSSGGQIAATDKALQASQAAMTNTFNADYSTAFSEQQSVLGQTMAKFAAFAANPMGYTPQQLKTATTSINENTATAAKQALGQAAAFAAAHGGSADISGGGAADLAARGTYAAGLSKAGSLAQLSQQNQEMKQQNMWKGLAGLSGVGGEFGNAASGAASGAGSAAGTSVSAGSGALAAQQAGWENTFGVIKGITGLATAATGVAGLFDGAANAAIPVGNSFVSGGDLAAG